MSDDPTKQNLDNATAASHKGRVKKPESRNPSVKFLSSSRPLRKNPSKIDLKTTFFVSEKRCF